MSSLQLRRIPPFLLIGASFLLGALPGLRGSAFRGLRPRVLLLGVYGLFTYHLCLFTALRAGPPVETNLINYLWPLLMVVLTPLILPGCALKPRHLVGALLGFCGAALLVTGGSPGSFAGRALGYGLALAAAVIWSTYSLLTKRVGDFPTETVAVFCLASGALSLACHAAFESRYLFVGSDGPWLLYMGLGPFGAAFYLWDRAVKDGDPRAIGTLAYLTPLLSTLWLVLFGAGRLSAASAIAAALIVGGAAIGGR